MSQPPLVALASSIGATYDLQTDRGRWELYQTAMRLAGAVLLLKAAVQDEPDKALATAVVLAMLERTPVDRHSEWLTLAPPEQRAYCEQRSWEIDLLRRAEDGSLGAEEVRSGNGDWSDWLQMRLTDASDDPDVVNVLVESGRTKRIRHTAGERAKRLSERPNGIRRG